MRTPPLLADFTHPRACKPICEKSLTLPRQSQILPAFFVRQVISYCLNDIEGESGYFNCGGNNQELLLHHCPVGINDWSHVSVGNETQYEAVMSRIQGLSIGIVIVTTILLFLRVVLVLYISGAG